MYRACWLALCGGENQNSGSPLGKIFSLKAVGSEAPVSEISSTQLYVMGQSFIYIPTGFLPLHHSMADQLCLVGFLYWEEAVKPSRKAEQSQLQPFWEESDIEWCILPRVTIIWDVARGPVQPVWWCRVRTAVLCICQQNKPIQAQAVLFFISFFIPGAKHT